MNPIASDVPAATAPRRAQNFPLRGQGRGRARRAGFVPLMLALGLALTAWTGAGQSAAATPMTPAASELLQELAVEAKASNPAFAGFDAEKGKAFYHAERKHAKKNEMRSCATCHTADPRKPGTSDTGKDILPLAPVANAKAFTDRKNIDKWFSRNCPWVLERACTAEERGHFITYVFSTNN